MNSNLKLLSAGLLVAALAGCGGGGGGEMTEPMPTPEEECLAGNGVVYEDDVCKTADDLRKEGRDAEADRLAQEEADRKAAEDAVAARKAAANLRTVLAATIADIADTSTTDSLVKPADFADKDGSARETIRVMGRAYDVVYATAPDLSVADTNSRIKGSVFSTSGTITHKANARRASDSHQQFTTTGSYHGVMGTYTCTPTSQDSPNSCSSNVNQGGDLVLAGGAWTFKPDNGSQKVSTADGVEWGWWVDEATDGSIETVRVFFGTSAAVTANTSFGEGGKATYKGSAVGKYSIHRGAGADNDAGHFTADASLSANFGAGDAATISGMVDGFVGADGQTRDWTVELKSQTHASGVWGGTRPDPAVMTVWTMNGDKADAGGEWSGAFYGGTATATPTAVAGAFDATHGNIGNMVGAFGAEKE